MDTLDLVIIGLILVASAGGYRVGLTARAASWLGMALGLFLAARALPSIVEWNESAPPRSLLLLLVLVLVLGAFLGQALGLLIGLRLRLAIPKGAETADRIGGALTGTIGVLAAFWLILPIMSRVPEWPAQQARNSVIAEWLHENLPAAPDSGQALQRLLGPQVFDDAFGRAPDLGDPPVGSILPGDLVDQVSASTVKVEAAACSRIQEGSGAVLGPDLVVTNAHVVAGSSAVKVERYPDGVLLDADVVAFDPARDAAVLHVEDIDRPALPLDDGSFGPGGSGEVFGHPRGGPLELSPFSVGDEVDARGRDIYNEQSTMRRVLFLAADLQPGDSGGALVDTNGRVVGVAFAIAPDRPSVAYALAIEEITAVLGGVSPSPVETGPCLP